MCFRHCENILFQKFTSKIRFSNAEVVEAMVLRGTAIFNGEYKTTDHVLSIMEIK